MRPKTILLGVLLAGSALAQIPILTNKWTGITFGGYQTYVPGNTGWKVVGWESLWNLPHLNLNCTYGSFREISSEPNRSHICWDFRRNFVSVMNNSSTFHDAYMPEGGHDVQGIQLMGGSNDLLFHLGNFSGSQVVEKPQIAGYLFDPTGMAYRMLHPSHKPNYATNLAAGAFDIAENKYVSHGGTSFAGTSVFDPTTNAWTTGVQNCIGVWTTLSVCPNPSILDAAMVYRTANQRVYLFGGTYVGDPTSTELYEFTTATNTWRKLAPGGTPPAPRAKGAMAYDSLNDVVLLYGGSSTWPSQTTVNNTDVWDPDPTHCSGNTDGCWVQPSPIASPPAGFSATFYRLTYDPDANAFVLWNAESSGTAKLYVYRYAGTGPDVGDITAPTYTASSGYVNVSADSWAQHPAVAVSGSTVYATHAESGNNTDSSQCQWFKLQALSTTDGTWARVGPDACNAVVPDAWLSYNDGVGDGSTTFVSAVATFQTGCLAAGGSCVGKRVLISGRGTFTITSAPSQTSVVLDRAVDAGTNLPWVVAVDEFASFPTVHFQADDPDVKVVAGVPWVCGHFGSNRSFLDIGACFGYNSMSGAWDLGGLLPKITPGGLSNYYNHGHLKMADVGGVLHVAFQEYVPGVTSITETLLYVVAWDGTAFVQVGSGPLNRERNATTCGASSADCTRAESLAITDDGSGNACVAHTEYTTTSVINGMTDSVRHAYLECWNGSTWAAQGSYANNNSAYHADWISLTALAGDLYVSFSEKQTEAGVSKLAVRKWNGSAWSSVGGYLNRDATTGWVFRSSIGTDGTEIFIAWDEQQDFGVKPQVYVARWHSSAWSLLGGSLNKDPANGAASSPAMAFLDTLRPVVVWSELKFGTLQKTYSAEWNLSYWDTIGAPAATPPTITSSSPLTLGYVTVPYSYALVASGSQPALSWSCCVSGSLPSWATLSTGGVLSGTPNAAATSTFTVRATNNADPDDTKAFSLTIDNPCTISTTSLPNALQNRPFSEAVVTADCLSPVWSILSGSLPPGTALNAATGVISGSPTLPLVYSFTVGVADVAGNPTRALSITVTTGTPLQPSSSRDLVRGPIVH